MLLRAIERGVPNTAMTGFAGRLTDADRVPTGRGANWVRFA